MKYEHLTAYTLSRNLRFWLPALLHWAHIAFTLLDSCCRLAERQNQGASWPRTWLLRRKRLFCLTHLIAVLEVLHITLFE